MNIDDYHLRKHYNNKYCQNANGTIYSEEDLKKACKNFIGKPVSTKNSPSVNDICGVVVDTRYDEDKKRVIALCAIDKNNYPNIAKRIVETKDYRFEFGDGCIFIGTKEE